MHPSTSTGPRFHPRVDSLGEPTEPGSDRRISLRQNTFPQISFGSVVGDADTVGNLVQSQVAKHICDDTAKACSVDP